MLPMTSSRFQQNADFSLRLKSVGLRDLGPYSCQAYNGFTSPASFTVVVKAVGPVSSAATLGDEREYLRYVVDAPRPPPRRPHVQTQGGIYRLIILQYISHAFVWHLRRASAIRRESYL